LICHDFAPASGFGRIFIPDEFTPASDAMLARRSVIFYYITILPLLATLVKAMAEASYGRMGTSKGRTRAANPTARLHEMTAFTL
jgi:hypothetical protein